MENHKLHLTRTPDTSVVRTSNRNLTFQGLTAIVGSQKYFRPEQIFFEKNYSHEFRTDSRHEATCIAIHVYQAKIILKTLLKTQKPSDSFPF